MKKTIVISLIIGFLTSCGNENSVTEINDFVYEVNTNQRLTELIKNHKTEYPERNKVGTSTLRNLIDEKNQTYRIIAEINQPNETPGEYSFYYKNNSLVYAHLLQFNEISGKFNESDTIANSEFYFNQDKLIKQINKFGKLIDIENAEDIKDLSNLMLFIVGSEE